MAALRRLSRAPQAAAGTTATTLSGPPQTQHAKGLAITLAGVLLLTPDALLVRLIGTDSWSILVYRGYLTSIGLFVLLGVIYRGRAIGAVRQLGRPGLLAATLFALSSTAFVTALTLAPAADVLVIMAATPLLAALAGRIAYTERLPLRTWCAILVGMAGIAVAVSDKLAGSDALGIAAAIFAAAMLGSNLTVLRHNPRVNNLAAIGVGCLIMGTVALPLGDPLAVTGTSLHLAILLCLFLLPVATGLFTLGPRYISGAEVGLLLLLETILGPFWVWLALNEVPTIYTFVGGGVVLATLIVHSLVSLRRT